MEQNYIRCPKCSYVYTSDLEKCPNCGEPQPINEDLNDEPIFNLLD